MLSRDGQANTGTVRIVQSDNVEGTRVIKRSLQKCIGSGALYVKQIFRAQ